MKTSIASVGSHVGSIPELGFRIELEYEWEII